MKHRSLWEVSLWKINKMWKVNGVLQKSVQVVQYRVYPLSDNKLHAKVVDLRIILNKFT